MESELSPDTADKELLSPPVPIQTYRWEDLRRAREAGAYPWTHLLKPPLEGEITAEDIIRETTPIRSMSRDVSRSRTHSPVQDVQKILNLDSSPGSSRKHGEEGEDEGIQIPNFSNEIPQYCEEDNIDEAVKVFKATQDISAEISQLSTPLEVPKNISPKSILKRRTPEAHYVLTETREKTKCCHPLVNKIKHLADKTLHKLEKQDGEKSPLSKRKKNEVTQEIRQLRSSPGAVRRQKFGAIKLGDSDEMSKTLSLECATPPRKKREHIYEDIEESKLRESDIEDIDLEKSSNKIDTESIVEAKSNTSYDPSLCIEASNDLKPEDHVMEQLHKRHDISREAVVLDFDSEEPNIDEIFQNQLEEIERKDSPNITITEIIDDEDVDANNLLENTTKAGVEDVHDTNWSKPNRRWTSEDGSPLEKSVRPTREGSVQSYTPDVRCACQFFKSDSLLPERLNPIGTRPTSRASNFVLNESDHEYEIIEKPPPQIVYTAPSVEERHPLDRKEDELSSTTSLDRKQLQHTFDEEERSQTNEDEKTDEDKSGVEVLQKEIEDRYFVNTPSTVSRTECEVSTSQVDSSALENLPLKRENRSKNFESLDSKLHARFKESTGKLKSQAGKLKTKLQNIKSKQFSMPEKPKFKFPDRPKFTLPDRPKFNLPDRRKFSLPDRPKFKKINISEKLSLGDRKKFTFPERPKFNVPDLPKFKFPDRRKVNFPSFSKSKEYKVAHEKEGANTEIGNVTSTEFEVKTYPRLFKRKKKSDTITTSSPTLNREDTPPPTFTFTRTRKEPNPVSTYRSDSPAEPREYGNIEGNLHFNDDCSAGQRYDTSYDFDKIEENFIENHNDDTNFNYDHDISTSNTPPSKQEYTHVINEINNDEFFVRPRGISRENIQVREYLSDEIRQAFNIPKNALASMGCDSGNNQEPLYANDLEIEDPELMLDDNEEIRYSNEDLNDRDDGYYTFPPIRPNRAKRKKKEIEPIQYIDQSNNASMRFSDVDLGMAEDHMNDIPVHDNTNISETYLADRVKCEPEIAYGLESSVNTTGFPIQSQTLPAPPKRKKRFSKKEYYSSLTDFGNTNETKMYTESQGDVESDIIVYRTEHVYVVPEQAITATQQSPVPPRRSRNRSRSSHGTSFCDDDRTSHGAESLTLDTHIPVTDDMDVDTNIRHESPGYATVDKGNCNANKTDNCENTITPPVRRKKSHSSERKYYTVIPTKAAVPNRPPRKKSSASLMTLDSISKRSMSGDVTQYVEIDDPHFDDVHKDLNSGEIVSKMKDRPLPPPPRPPRGPKKKKNSNEQHENNITDYNATQYVHGTINDCDIVEIEVSTQTDPLPDDVDFELGLDENLDVSMSSSLRDIVEGDYLKESFTKLPESPRMSRPVSRSEKSIKLSDPKIAELSKPNIGRTSPTVILVERRVSSPTRINERDEILTEASLTVQHIDIDESVMPEVPPLPKSRIKMSNTHTPRDMISSPSTSDGRAIERLSETGRDMQLDNLITQKLQVKDLDVGRLNVSELQASKILVSEIEGMTLQVAELDSKSGHISVSGIEFSQTMIDEIVKNFAKLTPPSLSSPNATESIPEQQRPLSREEETQTDEAKVDSIAPIKAVVTESLLTNVAREEHKEKSPTPPPRPPRTNNDENSIPPQRPPPPDLTPLLYSYLQDLSMPPASFYHTRSPRERPFTEFHESQHSPPTTSRRPKRRPQPQNDSSSDEQLSKPTPRKIQPPARVHDQSVSEAGAQFLRACQNSITRTIRNLFNSLITYISGADDKKDVQMALVIFLVLIAGLIMFGISDSRTIHHHHWEFFNPPDGKQ